MLIANCMRGSCVLCLLLYFGTPAVVATTSFSVLFTLLLRLRPAIYIPFLLIVLSACYGSDKRQCQYSLETVGHICQQLFFRAFDHQFVKIANVIKNLGKELHCVVMCYWMIYQFQADVWYWLNVQIWLVMYKFISGDLRRR